MKRPPLKLLFLALALGRLQAAETVNSTAGLAFSSVDGAGSARAAALGSTYVGIAEGAASLPSNPAGLAGLGASEVALNHDSTLIGSFQESALFAMPLSRRVGLGASFNYGDNGSFEGRDESGRLLGDYAARTYGASLGLGFQAPGDLAFGAAIKANRQDLASVAVNAFAADFGAIWSPTPRLRVGAAYRNLGFDVEGAHLSQGLDVGVSSYFWKGEDVEWLAALSGEALSHGEDDLHLGLENTLYQVLSLRVGYRLSVSDPQAADGLSGWSLGGGVKLKSFKVDYAFVPLGEGGNTQRLSLTYAFQGAL